MNLEIHDASLEARIQRQMTATGVSTIEETLQRLLDTQEEQDRWLLDNKEAINAKLRRGMNQIERGEGIPDGQISAHMARLKTRVK